ncbi:MULTISPECIES: helix-turn-helix domain-containing protein [unclassified Neorhizobium]|uniref:helix-turn-helix domain-containing protein n=1 Tax=unclassified Neorhizobium TaxID=2629175 RepID=UPI001FF22081|nr:MULTISPECIES: helix-turn-helix transcriptional regulator [unclassified Neorhizobium]MCJ9668995.1 helix-turn-helix transcriptional regulator [Neorhizobium sp. SHOUNA12B]MCJ9744949.1 helix-turn-helix transcriptional regulator [Neorhizobium sp. SHOUNA12A]
MQHRRQARTSDTKFSCIGLLEIRVPEAVAIDEAIGRKIRARRMDLGLSQSMLGGTVGLSFQQIQKYESGANRVSSSTLFQMACRLGIPLTYFFSELPDPLSEGMGLRAESDRNWEYIRSPEGQLLVETALALPRQVRSRILALMEVMAAEET